MPVGASSGCCVRQNPTSLVGLLAASASGEPTSQVCWRCGYKWGKLELQVRSITCLNCGTTHDRDENAAKNIDQVGMGNRHDSLMNTEGM